MYNKDTRKYYASAYGWVVLSEDYTNKRKRCKHCGKVKRDGKLK